MRKARDQSNSRLSPSTVSTENPSASSVDSAAEMLNSRGGQGEPLLAERTPADRPGFSQQVQQATAQLGSTAFTQQPTPAVQGSSDAPSLEPAASPTSSLLPLPYSLSRSHEPNQSACNHSMDRVLDAAATPEGAMASDGLLLGQGGGSSSPGHSSREQSAPQAAAAAASRPESQDSHSKEAASSLAPASSRIRSAALAAAKYKQQQQQRQPDLSSSKVGKGGAAGLNEAAGQAVAQEENWTVEQGDRGAVYASPRNSRASAEEASYLVCP